MPSTATVTGTIGPGNVLTAKVFTNVISLKYNVAPVKTVDVEWDGGITTVNISAATTITMTVSSGVITATIS